MCAVWRAQAADAAPVRPTPLVTFRERSRSPGKMKELSQSCWTASGGCFPSGTTGVIPPSWSAWMPLSPLFPPPKYRTISLVHLDNFFFTALRPSHFMHSILRAIKHPLASPKPDSLGAKKLVPKCVYRCCEGYSEQRTFSLSRTPRVPPLSVARTSRPTGASVPISVLRV